MHDKHESVLCVGGVKKKDDVAKELAQWQAELEALEPVERRLILYVCDRFGWMSAIHLTAFFVSKGEQLFQETIPGERRVIQALAEEAGFCIRFLC